MSVAMETCSNNGGIGIANSNVVDRISDCEMFDDDGDNSTAYRASQRHEDAQQKLSSVVVQQNGPNLISAVDGPASCASRNNDIDCLVSCDTIRENNPSSNSIGCNSSCVVSDDGDEQSAASVIEPNNGGDSTTAVHAESATRPSVAAATSKTELSACPPLVILKTPPANSQTSAALATARPVAKLLQDTGLLLASERVFKYLLGIHRQNHRHKMKKEQSDNAAAADKQLLEKLESSYSNIVSKNIALNPKPLRRCVCGFRSESRNVLLWHRQCGGWGPGKCCMCDGKFSYRMRNQFERHMRIVHNMSAQRTGRPPTSSCSMCPTDLNSRYLMKQHESVCRNRFSLARNLAPNPNDEDIPIKPVVAATLVTAPTQDVTLLVNLPGGSTVIRTPLLTPAPLINQPSSSLTKSGTNLNSSLCQTLVTAGNVQSVSSAAHGSSSKQLFNVGGQLFSVMTDNRSSASRMQPVSTSVKSNKDVASYQICPLCSGFVKDEVALEMHMRIVHSLLSPTDTSVCWMCPKKDRVPTRHLLSHIADKHGPTVLSMLQRRKCSLCSSSPVFCSVSFFESHMITAHPTIFQSLESLWQSIEKLSPRRHHVSFSSDGTVHCRLCSCNFISRAFLCRHAHMAHGGVSCNCVECSSTNKPTEALVSVQPSQQQQQQQQSATVVISDDEDDVTCKKISLSGDQRQRPKPELQAEKIALQSLLDYDESIMDKIEEVLEVDGETILIVQGEENDNVDQAAV